MPIFYDLLIVAIVLLCLVLMSRGALRYERELTGRLNSRDKRRITKRRARQRKRRLAKPRR